jgi:seryl-tRNA(Sec) selenium transferase
LEKALRQGEIPVICRIHKGKVLLDARTITQEQLKDAANAVKRVFKQN